LSLPFKNAGTGGRGLCFGDVACLLQGDGERGVRERIVGGEGGEGEGGGDGGLEATGIAECANQAMVRLEGRGVSGDGGPEGLDGDGSVAGGELIHCPLTEFFGCGVRLGHDFFRIKADAEIAEGVLECLQER